MSRVFVYSLIILLSFHPPPGATASLTAQEEEQIERFQRYLRIRTAHPDPDYAAAAAFLLEEARSIGLHALAIEFVPGKPLLLISWPGSDPSLPSLLLNSHIDSVPAEPSRWIHPPFAAIRDAGGRIFARGAQDDKSIAVQYLEALRNLKAAGFVPARSVHISLVPDEEIGGADGAARFAASEQFRALNVGFVLDEGQASPTDEFRVFYADRSPWSLIVRSVGAPGHGSRMFDGGAMENLMDCVEAIARFRESQFDQVKSGSKAASEVISVNPVYMKAGTPSPTLIQKGPIRDNKGRPLATPTDESNPWWSVFKQAVLASGGKLAKPEILSSTTDARFMRQMGIPALGFSPMANTPILLHDHNEFLMDSVFLKGIKVYEHVISALSSLPETSV
ncbi:uncharacterized protein LOC135677077 isoform X2 [Musa acuminata AAA Group]|uniref:uncharacterized protein LOC135677077 isoform X2 n=1 Tax=Musa acuminata AAA Group TaxID=214697 RepID=UPI0031D9E41A